MDLHIENKTIIFKQKFCQEYQQNIKYYLGEY